MPKRDKKRAKRRRARSAWTPLGPDDRGVIPRPVRLMAERVDDFAVLLANSTDPDGMLAHLEGEISEGARRIAELARHQDAFDLLEKVRMNEVMHNPETYAETEHEGMPAAVEVV